MTRNTGLILSNIVPMNLKLHICINILLVGPLHFNSKAESFDGNFSKIFTFFRRLSGERNRCCCLPDFDEYVM